MEQAGRLGLINDIDSAGQRSAHGKRETDSGVGLGLQYLATTIEACRADVMTKMVFASRRLHSGARNGQVLVGAVHTALGRRLLVLLNGHAILLGLRWQAM